VLGEQADKEVDAAKSRSLSLASQDRTSGSISTSYRLEEIQGIAEHYPVFRIEYEGHADTRRGWGK
jgi:hypothetical protein